MISWNRQPQTVVLLWAALALTLLLGILEAVPMAADAGKLVLDGLWLAMLIYLLKFARDAVDNTLWIFAGWILCFLLAASLTAAVQGVKPWFYLWGLRSNFRFYVIFLGVGAFFRP